MATLLNFIDLDFWSTGKAGGEREEEGRLAIFGASVPSAVTAVTSAPSAPSA